MPRLSSELFHRYEEFCLRGSVGMFQPMSPHVRFMNILRFHRVTGASILARVWVQHQNDTYFLYPKFCVVPQACEDHQGTEVTHALR